MSDVKLEKKKISTINEIESAEEDDEDQKKIPDETIDVDDVDDPDDPIEYDSDYEEESDDEPCDEDNEMLNKSDYYRVVKVIPADMRVTSNVMTMWEYSDVIGIRQTEIENGAPVYTDVTGVVDPRDMAIKELFDRKCPLKIKRALNPFLEEQWSCREMAFPADVRHA